ncbi:MAG: DUF2188 domain-containing protein [Deltaproteobacteria bacterium]|nr:DUF2188 domain-containing protein [Deltaproteobacteria bacterium]
MSKRKAHHVTPDGKVGWRVIAEGAQKSPALLDNKIDAIVRVKELAKSAPLGQIKTQKKRREKPN